MSEQKQIKYDLDGEQYVTTALMNLVNEYPGLLDGEEITFSTLEESSGIAVFPVSGAVIETETESITEYVTEVCLYPFSVVYRASVSSSRKEEIKEFLDNIGKWLEKKPVVIDGEVHKLDYYPDLTDKREFLEFRRQTPSYLESTNENGSENWVIYINARYKYEYQK